jgi:hypothetical protein
MSYEHPKADAFSAKLDALFNEVDVFLEEEWGEAYPLHPARPRHGETANPEMDGLFRAMPDFTPGV